MNIDAKAREIAAHFAIPQTNANFGFIAAALRSARSEALEEAANAADRHNGMPGAIAEKVATAIRALKDTTP